MTQPAWLKVCNTDDLIADGGVCVLLGQQQIALFFESAKAQVYAVSNLDPVQGVECISRGLMGCVGSQVYVATPLLKHRYELATGQSLDDGDLPLACWQARILDQAVELYTAPVSLAEASHG